MGTSKFIDLTGAECGLLRVVAIGRKQRHHQYWLCVCSCGAEKEVRSDVIAEQKQKSCGCQTVHNKRHGKSGTGIYHVWLNMKRRCRDPKHHAYKNYGARGIDVCERWNAFENFYADMGDRPLGRTLDRIDNSLGYEPGNCRWATITEQARNMRSNRLITLSGETKSLAEWCEIHGQPYRRVLRRLSVGTDPQIALTEKGNMNRKECRKQLGK